MRSARPRHGASPRAGAPPCRPHSALRRRSHKYPPAGQPPRQHAVSSPASAGSISPAHPTRPGGRRQARLPGSAPLHRRTPHRPPPTRWNAPHPAARCRRVPVAEAPCTPRPKPPNHPQRRDRGGASGGRRGDRASVARALCIELARKAHRASVWVVGPSWLALPPSGSPVQVEPFRRPTAIPLEPSPHSAA